MIHDELLTRAKACMPGGVSSPVRSFRGVGGTPIFMDRGEGAYLVDVGGRRYVDYVLSWGPLVAGHAHPAVVEALIAAVRKGTSFGCPTVAEIHLAEKIKSMMPGLDRVRFVCSGTEATMSALRLARAATGRDRIVKFSGCYHGHADGLLSDAGSGIATLGIPGCPGVTASTAAETITLEYNDSAAFKSLMDREGSTVAAVIVEPVVGNMGVVPPLPGFLETLREATRACGALLVFDEVMTGFRVALGGAQALYGIQPDLTCLGKVIGGGMPVGAYGGPAALMDRVAPAGPVYQAGTLAGNPAAMAAGLATLDLIGAPGAFDAIAARARRLGDGLAAEAAKQGVPVQVQRVGTMLSMYFNAHPVTNYTVAKTSDAALYGRYFHRMLAEGVYLAPSAYEAAFLSMAHDDAVVDFTLAAHSRALAAARS